MKKRIALLLTLILSGTVLVNSCGTPASDTKGSADIASSTGENGSSSYEKEDAATTEIQKEIESKTDNAGQTQKKNSDKVYRFDSDMFAAMAEGTEKSFIFSPYSIKDCMTIPYTGMSEKARKALKKEGISKDTADSIAAFDKKTKKIRHINVANKVYLNKEYQDRYHMDYFRKDRMELVTMDSGTAGKINSWVSDQTNKKINNLIDPGSIDSDTSMVDVNAIWTKLRWYEDFDTDAIKWKADKKKYKGFCGEIDYTKVRKIKDGYLIEVPFKKEKIEGTKKYLKTSMYIYIKKDDKDGKKIMEAVKDKKLKLDKLTNVKKNYKSIDYYDEVYLHIPNFEYNFTDRTIDEKLREINLGDILSEEAYRKIGPMKVSGIAHAAYIKVNKTGAEAAAATTVPTISGGWMEESLKIKNIYLDHPFAFVIKERSAKGHILFAGIVNKDALKKASAADIKAGDENYVSDSD